MDQAKTDKIEVIYSRISVQNAAEANGETLQKRALPCGKKYHVFISYCNIDTAWVKETVDKLETYHGFKCCEYDRDNTPGTPLLKFAADSIKNSCKTLLVITKQAMQSEFVQHEIQMAMHQGFNEKRKCLVPVLLEDCEVPHYLNVLNYIDARDPSRKDIWWTRLIRELEIQSNNDGYIKQDAVAFTLGRSTHAGSTDGSTIVFDKVITLMGVSSDIQRTGVFTCPAEGIYKFQVYSLSFFNARIWLELYRNKELVASLYGYTLCDYATAGNAVILSLSKDEVVSVKAHTGLEIILYGALGEIYTTFSGIRLTDSLVTVSNTIVAFFVGLSTDTLVTQNSKVVFDRILINLNIAYNVNTGVFTAPRPGLYEFNVHMLGLSSQMAWLELHHNHQYIISIWSNPLNHNGFASNSALIQLDAGDIVYVKVRDKRNFILYGRRDQIFCTFSGYLCLSAFPS